MDNRVVIKISVSPATKSSIEVITGRYGMSQQELAGRVFDWLASQDETIQAGVLGLLPRDMQVDVAEIYMERIKAKRFRPVRGKPVPGKKS